MAIGKRIRFFRNRKGMTQKQLGELLGFLRMENPVPPLVITRSTCRLSARRIR